MPTTLRSIPAVLLIATGAVSLMGTAALAEDTACKASARDMRSSCNFELKEEWHAIVANCRQFGRASEREACRDQARDDREEAVELCGDQFHARVDACDLLHENRYSDPLADERIHFIDPDAIPGRYRPNPYVSLVAGHTYVLRAGEDFEELVVVHVTDEVREIQEVRCRVVVDVVLKVADDEDTAAVDYIPVEVTDDWFAQDKHGDVYYCGEIARNFEEGVLRDLDGSFESGIDFAKAGLLVAARPKAKLSHRQEYALGEAEDIIEYLARNTSPSAKEGGENPSYRCNGKCLKTFDFAPLDPEATEFKYYLPGTGFVLAVSMEDDELTGEREELVCVGHSLGVLRSKACGIEDAEELLDDLCELHPEAFCADD